MITNAVLEEALKKITEIAYVKVEGDGYHYNLTIVSDAFIGKSKVARQQWVYNAIKEYIQTGSLHAVTMKTWTKEEWEHKNG